MSDFDLKQLIDNADKILIGLGEDFDYVGEDELSLNDILNKLSDMHDECLAPYVYDAYRTLHGIDTYSSLSNIIEWIKDKDYYVLTTSSNIRLEALGWKQGRFVSPCISPAKLQCYKKCGDGPVAMTDSNKQQLLEFGRKCIEDIDAYEVPDLGKCPNCGEILYPNNVFAPNYDEKGYLDAWSKYTAWLPYTLRTKLLIIEIGVGMNFPGMIRMPFEKTAELNQNAVFVRINDSFPYLPAGLAGRSYIVKKNAIDWLNTMC